ncbi:MAG: Isopenicillin N epimerase [Gemmatimonadaceae bacterium]|nr:Isopenicillin N epimerase [Gemmatimonadaceae bacterium]
MHRRSFVAAAAGAITLHRDARSILGRALQRVERATPDQAAQDEDFWFTVREAFTIDRNIINLNNGSVAPSPRTVQQAQRDYLAITNMQPSYYVDEMLYPGFETIRRRLAAGFGCDPEEVAITRNTTEALEIVQFGMQLQRGDEILTTTQDYPSMITTWRQRVRRDGVTLRMIPFPVPPDGQDDLFHRIESAIGPRTKVIHISHITYTTGQIFPVKRICQMARQRDIEVVVDGGHSFAQFPFTRDDLDCDYFGTSLHKWLSAPVGTGFLYVRRLKIPRIWSLFASPEEITDNIRKFEGIGTFPVHVRNPITEAMDFHESIGAERKAARLRFLRRRWSGRVASLPGVKLLTPDGYAESCAIGTMRMEGIDAVRLTDYLMKRYRIHVRPRTVEGEWSGIRVTPNVYTTLEEVDAFATAIEEIAARGMS